jgi:hypothetical protein
VKVHTEFAIAAIAMAPLLAVSWAVTRQYEVQGPPFDSATNMARTRTSLPANKGFDVQRVQVDTFKGTTTPSAFAASPQERAAAHALAPKSEAARFANNGTPVLH